MQGPIPECSSCNVAKGHRLPFPERQHNTTGILDLVHMDIYGTIRPQSAGGNIYFIPYIDDHSRRVSIDFQFHKARNLASLSRNSSRILSKRRPSKRAVVGKGGRDGVVYS
jgi:hypothetical protein